MAHCARRGEGDLTWRECEESWMMSRALGESDEGRMEEARRAIGADVV